MDIREMFYEKRQNTQNFDKVNCDSNVEYTEYIFFFVTALEDYFIIN